MSAYEAVLEVQNQGIRQARQAARDVGGGVMVQDAVDNVYYTMSPDWQYNVNPYRDMNTSHYAPAPVPGLILAQPIIKEHPEVFDPIAETILHPIEGIEKGVTWTLQQFLDVTTSILIRNPIIVAIGALIMYKTFLK